jgi:hypothetical protein
MEAKEKCSSWFLRSLAVRAIQLTVVVSVGPKM